jgi:hypothetical protein
MDESEQSRISPILLVYWFLLAVALAFAFFAAKEAAAIWSRKPLQARIVSRDMRVEVREMSGQRSKYLALIAVADLRFENLATREQWQETREDMIPKESLISLAFLDQWRPGTVLDPRPDNGWLPVLAFGIGVWMFGTFAWMTKPFAEGGGMDGIGVKFLALAVLPIGVAAFGINHKLSTERAEKALHREPVQGTRVTIPIDTLFTELASLGVKAGDDVRKFLNTDTLDYCEYTWDGKVWRSVSLWCQPPPGENCAGRVNPANPCDIKWANEP